MKRGDRFVLDLALVRLKKPYHQRLVELSRVDSVFHRFEV